MSHEDWHPNIVSVIGPFERRPYWQEFLWMAFAFILGLVIGHSL